MAKKITRSGAGFKVGGYYFSTIELAQFASTRPNLLKILGKKK
tara:strand:- start:246 stop:374 length:129 start_codon:yes stop_codon:yes gene_type:complete